MAQKAQPLCANVNAIATLLQQSYQGGRGLLIVEATTYPTTCQLQTQSVSGKWVPVGVNNTADGVQQLDLPMGQYRMFINGGTVSALYATLVSVTYT